MMNAALRAFVRERAGRRCEYCRLHEDDADFLSFHVEHVVAKQHGGTDDPDILCFACAECNWAKGPNLAGLLGRQTLSAWFKSWVFQVTVRTVPMPRRWKFFCRRTDGRLGDAGSGKSPVCLTMRRH